jgi:hypothetical protein
MDEMLEAAILGATKDDDIEEAVHHFRDLTYLGKSGVN